MQSEHRSGRGADEPHKTESHNSRTCLLLFLNLDSIVRQRVSREYFHNEVSQFNQWTGKPFLRECTMHGKQSIPPTMPHNTAKMVSLQPQGAHSFCSLIVPGHLHQPSAWQSTTTRKRDMRRSYSSQGKQGHKLSIEEAITSWSDTATHFSQSNSLRAWSYRLLTRLAALLTLAGSVSPNWTGRFSAALSEPFEPSDVAQ